MWVVWDEITFVAFRLFEPDVVLLGRCFNRSHVNEGADSYGRSLFRGIAEWAVPTEHC